MTASPNNTTYSNDILGNRTGTTITSGLGNQTGAMTWDCLNRMVSMNATGAIAHSDYEYRADGMRVQKSYHSGAIHSISAGTLGGPTTEPPAPTSPSGDVTSWYRYDGQMPMQTSVLRADGSTTLTNNGLGARGIDYVSVVSTPASGSPTTTLAFPIYDAHGNEVATLSRGTSAPYSIANQRSYGAWGEIRQGASTGGPRGRYCGNLGHVQDDESGLIYMRARYYEPGSGRFISEDAGMDGKNWFAYCGDNPVGYFDGNGSIKSDIAEILRWMRELFEDGDITPEYYAEYKDRSSGLRQIIHDFKEKGAGDWAEEDFKDMVKADCLSRESGEELGDTEELLSDMAAGEDPSLILLEQQTVVSEVAEAGLEG